MTTGFLIGIAAALFWSFTNLIDKYLVQRFCTNKGVGALLLLSSFFPIALLPVALLATEHDPWLTLPQIAVLMLSGVLTVGWIYFYLRALYEDDVSTVMPLFQLTPVFALLFALLLLSELPNSTEIFYGSIIVIGSMVISWEQSTRSFKYRLLLYILISSAMIALMNTLFKFVAIEADFWISIFWQSTGTVLTGVMIFLLNPTFRMRFTEFMAENWGLGISLNTLNETLTLIGDVLFAYAILLAPLALIQTTEAYQPVFVFLFGTLLTFLAPRFMEEDVAASTLIQKVLGIALVVLGSYLLALG